MSLVDAVNSLNTAGISYSITGGTPQTSDMSLYVVTGFTNKIKKDEIVKIQVKKNETNPPINPDKDDATTTTPEDGDSTNANAGVDNGNGNGNANGKPNSTANN